MAPGSLWGAGRGDGARVRDRDDIGPQRAAAVDPSCQRFTSRTAAADRPDLQRTSGRRAEYGDSCRSQRHGRLPRVHGGPGRPDTHHIHRSARHGRLYRALEGALRHRWSHDQRVSPVWRRGGASRGWTGGQRGGRPACVRSPRSVGHLRRGNPTRRHGLVPVFHPAARADTVRCGWRVAGAGGDRPPAAGHHRCVGSGPPVRSDR